MSPERQQSAWKVIEDWMPRLRISSASSLPHGVQEMEGEGRRTLELAEGALELGRWLQRPPERRGRCGTGERHPKNTSKKHQKSKVRQQQNKAFY